MIAPASLDDVPRAAALLAATYDDRLITVAGVRYGFESVLPEDRRQYWRAELDGELVGWAVGGLDAFASSPTAGFVAITVDAAQRRRGIGSALWDVASAHLDRIGARRVVSFSRADARHEGVRSRTGIHRRGDRDGVRRRPADDRSARRRHRRGSRSSR